MIWNERLIEAVRENSLPRVQEALAAGADPNTRTGGRHVCDLVPHRGDAIRCALVEAGAWDATMRSSLVWAVRTGRAETVKALVERGADVDVSTHSGTPLLVATAMERADLVDLLLRAGADPDAGGGFDVPLTAAVKLGSAPLVRRLLEGGARPDAVAEYTDATALALAAARGDAELIALLLRAGAQVDGRCSRVVLDGGTGPAPADSTPLMFAVRAHHAEAARVLLAAGADPHARDAAGLSASDDAAGDTLAAMRAAGVKERERSPAERLLGAAERGDADEISRCLAEGAPVDAPDDRKATRGFTPLMLAAENGHAECARRLLDAGAAVDAVEPGDAKRVRSMLSHMGPEEMRKAGLTLGRPPLLLAVAGGHQAVVDVLVDRGANLAAADHAGDAALHLAVRDGSEALVGRLLGAGADPAQKGSGAETPLQAAASTGHGDAARLVLEKLAGGKRKPSGLNVALIHACCYCDLDLVRRLLDAGADAAAFRKDLGSALSCVCSASRYVPTGEAAVRGPVTLDAGGSRTLVPYPEDEMLALARVLLERGANPDQPGNLGTPLMNAARNGYARLARALLDAGAEPDVADNGGKTALHYAELYGQEEVAGLLRGLGARGQAVPEESAPARVPREAPLPDFGRAAVEAEAYRTAVAELARRCGSDPQPWGGVEGPFLLHVQTRLRESLDVEALQREFPDFFLFAPIYTRRGGPEKIAILPVPDKYAALALQQTNGANLGLGSADVIDWMRQLEADHPYALTTVTHDTLAGRFLSRVSDPAGLADRMYAFCPDIVDQGTGTVEALADEVARSSTFFFWWD